MNHAERLARTRAIRFARRPRWRPGKRPGGARPRRNAVRRPWYTAAAIRKAQQQAAKWAWMLDDIQPALNRDLADAESGHRSRKNREAMRAIDSQVWHYKGITVPVWVESTMTITASDKAGNTIAEAFVTPAPDDPAAFLDEVRAGVRAELEKP